MLISIIIPAYNVENYIEECVHSAFAQTYPDIEVICIDNKSTDQTWQKLEQLKQQYPQLIIEKELKPGAPAARNRGLKLSKGQWLQFLDADDLLKPEKIAHQVALINNSPDADVPFIAAVCLKRDLDGNEKKSSLSKEHPLKSLFSTNLGNTCANLWNRDYIEKINGWDESLKSSQEADLMFRLLQEKDDVLYDDEPLTIVRIRPEGQISQDNFEKKYTRFFNKRLEMRNWLKENRKDFYSKNVDFFEDGLFTILKTIAYENLNLADRLYKQHLKGFRPGKDQHHSTTIYIKLFNLFGFRFAEYSRKLFGKKPIE